MTFLFVGSSVCRWLPPDLPSRECPCLKLVVIVARIFAIIWTLVPPQGTFTPLDHAHAGRTQHDGADGIEFLVVIQRLLATAHLSR